mgnify:CR=1 FL=1
MKNSILIVDMGFRADCLQLLLNRLHNDNYNWVIIKELYSIKEALVKAPCNAILIGATHDNAVGLSGHLQDCNQNGDSIPILLCLIDDASFNCEDALSLAVDDFSYAPINANDVILRLRRLLQKREVRHGEKDQTILDKIKNASLHGQVEPDALQKVIGQSEAFTFVKRQLTRLAACDVTILITGETGTGKEMCAQAIHQLSSRAKAPFVPVNCSAIPTELFENELFGHESGAYTDARQKKRGLIAEAEGGTLFLDEVDSLHPLAQVKLLRFLQDRQYKPLGASSYKQANVRLLAATNQDLKSKVREGSFREDLYFRIKIVSVSLPPLRERTVDIQSLATHFLTAATQEYGMPKLRFTADAVKKLTHYAWPGNVRELENTVRQAVVLADGAEISARDLKLQSESQNSVNSSEESFNQAKARVIESFEKSYLQQVLSASGGNISQAARFAKKDRRTFFGLLKKHGLLQLNSSLYSSFKPQAC